MVDVTPSSAPQHSLMPSVSIERPVWRCNGAALIADTPHSKIADDELDENYISYMEELWLQDYGYPY